MTKQQAEQLYSLVNSETWKVFIEYKQDRLNFFHEQLEWEEKDVKKVQGRIEEIRTDLDLKKHIDIFLHNN